MFWVRVMGGLEGFPVEVIINNKLGQTARFAGMFQGWLPRRAQGILVASPLVLGGRCSHLSGESSCSPNARPTSYPSGVPRRRGHHVFTIEVQCVQPLGAVPSIRPRKQV